MKCSVIGSDMYLVNFITTQILTRMYFSETRMAPRYEICVGLEKGHKTTPNTLKPKPSNAKVCIVLPEILCSTLTFSRAS